MVGQYGKMDYAFQMAGLVMSKSFESRIKKLEVKNQVNQESVPILVYRSSKQTLEQAKAEYKEKHGFELPGNAKIIEICLIGASRNANLKCKR